MHCRSISSMFDQREGVHENAPDIRDQDTKVYLIAPAEAQPMSLSNISTDDGTFYSSSTSDSLVVREFHDALMRNHDMAVAVSAIKALTSVMRKSTATTMMGLEKELREAANSLERCNPTAISLQAGCELFLRFVTRTAATYAENEDFNVCKAMLIQRGTRFTETSVRARQTIAEIGATFVRNGMVVLTHGNSRVVFTLLQRAASKGVRFRVIVTEGRPDSTGVSMARDIEKLGIPVTMVLDSGVAYAMERVSMVLVGAEGVVESGGIINKLGTYQISLCAKALNVPVYVAAESYKFARIYPLGQHDFLSDRKHVDFGPLLPRDVAVDNPSADYTPPSCIKLLLTDLGVLTPAAVSDELIQLYL
uniref:Translation initiation factor eIF2B subunit alpha n=1 Tax=Tetraselmis sp. GSL018 TaxID=582737 RepID=A0A061S326_9CHLO|mmetsp:Transcript_6847/g.16548  ORF Transcript_6847/g.16548 Transcript_6847/m.16548 type:complete len:364 (-) Transcript_6847:78-1169(-)